MSIIKLLFRLSASVLTTARVTLMVVVNMLWYREKDTDIEFAQDAIDEYKVCYQCNLVFGLT